MTSIFIINSSKHFKNLVLILLQVNQLFSKTSSANEKKKHLVGSLGFIIKNRQTVNHL